MFEKHNRRKEAERQAALARQAAARLEAWEGEEQQLEEFLYTAENFTGLGYDNDEGLKIPIQLKKDELVFLVAENVGLIEPQRGAGHWEGRSSGVSVRVPGTRSMRYRIGATRGHFVQGEERPALIDEGTATITNQRVVFTGAKQAREWSFGKLLAVQHAENAPWTSIEVSNRQKMSGIFYGDNLSDVFRFRLDLALAAFNGTKDSLIKELRDEVAEHQARKPVAALRAAAATPPADGVQPLAPGAPRNAEDESAPSPAGPTAGAGDGNDAVPSNESTASPGPVDRIPSPSVPASPQELPPPTWAPDPSGRHELRFWDGKSWTQHVFDRGQQSQDPL